MGDDLVSEGPFMFRQVRHLISKARGHLTLVSCGLVIVITWSLVLINRVNDREEFIERATNETTNIARTSSEYLEQVIASFDQILIAARFAGITPASRRMLSQVAEASNLSGSIFNISLYDSTGALIAGTAPGTLTANIADRIWFKDFQVRAEDQLFIGPPVISRTVNRLSVIIARGIRDDLGRFQGMIGMSIAPELLAAFFQNIPLGQHGEIDLIGRDGMIYVRVANDRTIFGEQIYQTGIKKLLSQAVATSSGTSFVSAADSNDNIAMYYSYKSLSIYPLVVIAGVSEDEILKSYWSETMQIIAATLLFSVSLVVASVIGHRRMKIIRDQADDMRHQALSLQEKNQELAEQSLALIEATRQTQAADRLKGEFIANMSHELRTPLNAIIGFSTVLLDSPDETCNPNRRANLERINAAGHHLLDLVTGVLEMAKLESGSLEVTVEIVDLTKLITECIEMTEVLQEAKAIELTFDHPPSCFAIGDQIRTRQITLNILSNAIKFSPEGSRLTVKVSGGGLEPAVVEIADNGIGMTEDEIEVALIPFAQVSSGHAKRYDGTGLGLPLAKRLVETQGGKLIVESVKGLGTTVRFDLPGARCS